MNKDEIIRMAQESGFNWPEIHTTTIEERLERFANLVADAERTAMMERSRTIIVQAGERGAAVERETIAQLFDAIPELVMPARRDDGVCIICGFSPKRAAEAIRARTKP